MRFRAPTIRDLLKATGLPMHHHRATDGRVVIISHDTPGAGMFDQLVHRGRRCPYRLCEPGQTYTMHTPRGDRPATGRERDWYRPSRAAVVAANARKRARLLLEKKP